MSDVVRETQLVYDEIAPLYDEQTLTPSGELLAHLQAFAAAARGPIADLGCGTGRHLSWFDDAVGVDLSDGMLAIARTRGRVVRGDLRCPPVRELAGIWSCASLLHVPRGEVPHVLSTWQRCLRRGGVLGLSTSLGEGEGWETVPYARSRERWFVHHTEETLLGQLAGAGFAVRSVARRTTNREWLMVLAEVR